MLTLDDERSNYLCRVLRKRRGETIHCFDGAGMAFSCTLTEANPRQAILAVSSVQPREPKPDATLAIALSMVKGQAMDRAIQQATELGATHIWLFGSDHSTAKAATTQQGSDQRRAGNKQRHWQKIIDGASEQCGRLHLPQFALLDKAELLAKPLNKIVFQAGHPELPQRLEVGGHVLLVGPEGGWSEAELEQFTRHGCAIFGLGPLILRAETVPAVALAMTRRALTA